MKPFLMNFAVKVQDSGLDYELRYNQALDANEIIRKSAGTLEPLLLLQTQTRVKRENPDDLPSNSQPDIVQYLGSKTVTEVRAEKPDVGMEQDLLEFINTGTSTKTKSEGPDYN